MPKPHRRWIGVFVLLLALSSLIVYVALTNPLQSKRTGIVTNRSRPELKKFKSEAEFKEYLIQSQGLVDTVTSRGAAESMVSLQAPTMDIETTEENSLKRYSNTNIQVQGIDEPDIVKTDGRAIYYSLQMFYEYFPLWDRSVMSEPAESGVSSSGETTLPGIGIDAVEPVAPDSKLIAPEIIPPNNNSTKIITTRTGTELEVSSSINTSGELLLADSKLVVISGLQLRAYDVSDYVNPRELWSEEFDSNSTIIATRLLGDKIFVTSMQWVNSSSPCPIPLTTRGTTVLCTDIYYPAEPISTNTTYTISVLDLKTGEHKETVSFVGNQGQSVIYMSPDNIYVTYGFQESQAKLMFDFFLNNSADLVSKEVLNRIQQLSEYELYEQTKITELYTILENYYNLLDNDERLKLESTIQNRASEYMKSHRRDIEKTGIVQISLEDLSVRNTASVPGSVLNQFSIDEYEGDLRIATTTNNSFMFSANESVNDIYILDKSLNVRGSILDLGLSEQIYSARFVGDKGYLVTFKQVDPFYVFDLSDPDNPRKTGELKIPGYSSYLHPLSDSLVVGVGRDGGNVKATLFSVRDPSNPLELSTFSINESWSEVENNHHAFLHDAEHSIFFIPVSNNGYVLSYDNDKLELETAIADVQAERALYINDYLYVIGKEKIVVVDENTGERVSELTF